MLKKFNEFVNENLQLETLNLSKYNSIIDYTSLTETETEADIISLCEKAKILQTKSVCVYPKWVKKSAECLEDSNVLVCTVISFPKGTDKTSAKVAETKQAIEDGADEIDMVLDWRLLKEMFQIDDEDKSFKILEELKDDVYQVVEECHKHTNKVGEKVILKVIVESSELTIEETEMATNICLDAGADFIKTSTGKIGVGAELNKVKSMYDTIKKEGEDMKIKASGGIRTVDDINAFLPYVDRLGMGFGSVDQINGIQGEQVSTY